MAKYIEKEVAVKIAKKYGLTNGSVLGRHSGIADCIASEIATLPIADVAPVVHGRWDDEHKCTVCHNEAFYKISSIRPDYDYDWEENLVETGDYIWDTEWIETAYCPKCGAKMDKEE